MRPDERDPAYLWDMKEAARGVAENVKGLTFEQYEKDDNLRLAIERRIEIIGEAAGRVSESMKNAHPEIPWRKVIAQRNVLVHDYAEIDDMLVWRVAIEHIPELLEALEAMLPT